MQPHTAVQIPLHNHAREGMIRLSAFARDKGKLAGSLSILLLKYTVSHDLRNRTGDIHW